MENKTSKYFKYAIGEIVLVVIGILIALQINNWNENRKERTQELHYLKNLKVDLKMNIVHIDNYIKTRTKAIASATTILDHFEGKPITDYDAFSANTIDIYTWRKFFQINNTFQELMNSGNLAIISNDSIKDTYLNMESLYKVMKDQEEHFRFDSELLLYEPNYSQVDLNPVVKNYTYKVTNGVAGEKTDLPKHQYDEMLKDLKQKNGFVMAVYEFSAMNTQLNEMKIMCQQLISLIDKDLNKN
ncbi:DUF6090 family protein [Polaribacter sp.]